jgi:hypothetical protein
VLAPLLLTLLGVCAAVLPAPLGFPDPPDIAPLGALVAGAVWGWLAWRRRRGWRRLATASAQAFAAAAIGAWMLLFSAYGAAPEAPRPGDRAPAITAVRVRDGARFDLEAERGRQVLLVFFRGKW